MIDKIDSKILALLETDGRIPMNEIARQVSLSSPSVAERVRRMEANGILTRFTIEIDPAKWGYNLEAIVHFKPRAGHLQTVEDMILKQKRFTSFDKITGDATFIARLALQSIGEMHTILDPFHEHAETSTSLVTSTPLKARLPRD